MNWWVRMDWADAHTVYVGNPTFDLLEWSGPFPSFSAMRTYIVRAGMVESENINSQLREWRTKRKGEALEMAGVEGHDWSEEAGW